ncbi:MAG: NeuD/PglB/VioB family sugar acetyltransferase [Bacteroidales bacterium]|nr:NeuD/PglB/VioB family sugar acetyltransferase [Bacteroidales bacterium]
MKKKVIIVGDGGHAKILIDILLETKQYKILGVTSKQNNKKEFCGLPVLGDDSVLYSYYEKGMKNIALGIGGFKDNKLRTAIFNKFHSKGFNIINAIHPKAVIAKSVLLNKGITVFAGAILNSEVKIGNNVIIATGATIDHESSIGDNCLISAGVTIGANVKVGKGTLCALGSKLISGINIGHMVLVAAGAVVVNDINANTSVFGIPAKEKIK